MALVLMATHGWGTLFIDPADLEAGVGLQSSFTNPADATAATHYADDTGASPSTGPVTADANGRLMRWVEEGTYNQELPGGTVLEVQALSGSTLASVGSDVATRALKANLPLHAADYGAIADGTSHPLSEGYGTLGAAQAVYPFVTALTQEFDWAAVRKAQSLLDTTIGGIVDMGAGPLVFGADKITVGSFQHFQGRGSGAIGAGDDIRGCTTVLSTRDGDVFEFPASTYGWSLKNFTIMGDRTKTSQTLINLIPGGVTTELCGPGHFEDVWAFSGGLDCFSGWGPLEVTWDRCYFATAGRHAFYARGGWWNACNWNATLFRQAEQWGFLWTPGTGSGVQGEANVLHNCVIESNNTADGAYGGVMFGAGGGLLKLDSCYWENNSRSAGTPLLVAASDERSTLREDNCEWVESRPILHTGGHYVAEAPRYTCTEPQVVSTGVIPPEIRSPHCDSTIRQPGLKRHGVDVFLGSLGGGSFIGRVAGSGRPLVAGDFSLAAAWGSTASIQSIRGTDSAFSIIIRANGSGINANPSFDLTYKEGTWTTKPMWTASMGTYTTTTTDGQSLLVGSGNSTAMSVVYVGTPTAGRDYEFIVMVRG